MRRLIGGEEGALYNPERGELTWAPSTERRREGVVTTWARAARVYEARSRCGRPHVEGLGLPASLATSPHLLVEAAHILERLSRLEARYQVTFYARPIERALRRGELDEQVRRVYSYSLIYLPTSQSWTPCYEGEPTRWQWTACPRPKRKSAPTS